MILHEHSPQPIAIGHIVFTAEAAAAIGDPIRADRAKLALLEEEAVPVQVAVWVLVI